MSLETHKENKAIPQVNNLFLLLMRQLRIKQWTKNLLIFAVLLFSLDHFSVMNLVNTVIGFILFCFVSGSVYILNDYVDIEADKIHPTKKNRPMASGELNPTFTLLFGVALLTFSLIMSLFLSYLFTIVLVVYFIINVLYSLKLKEVVIIDIMIIAAGFVLRALAGGLIIDVNITPWFLLCTLLLSLFLAIGKRRNELFILNTESTSHRKVLAKYNMMLLDQLMVIVATSTIICYSMFTFSSGRTIHLMWTIPLVIYGVFRYLYLVHVEEKGGSPDRILLEDKHILYTVILYVLVVLVILITFE
ncbi:decaprenyl-phosphate phosphoribosyltransferase [Paenibacillus sp. An7]|uniref:decaprenyl-phosphate phosphoribosyltransferase n=1 Tax=Paenibacillus sp. An7 TaxID=2689577 RepID=UPI00135BAFDB|nr:decaprenyl-phosphate phosphoribosyltransferase [Paenibacillus sp. An7]